MRQRRQRCVIIVTARIITLTAVCEDVPLLPQQLLLFLLLLLLLLVVGDVIIVVVVDVDTIFFLVGGGGDGGVESLWCCGPGPADRQGTAGLYC